MDSADVSNLLKEAAELFIRPRFRQLEDDQIHEKNPGDLVTVADREAEVFLTEQLTKAYPDAVILGEEATAFDPSVLDRAAGADHVFTIDPVDGTRNFVHGSPDYAVMVAEVRGTETVRSWIYQPEYNLMFTAEVGAGAFGNDQQLAGHQGAPAVADLRGVESHTSKIDVGSGPLAQPGATWLSCGIDYPKAAMGEVDYLVYQHTKAWDHLPGALLVKETGGVTSFVDGQPYVIARRQPWIVTCIYPEAMVALRDELAKVLAGR